MQRAFETNSIKQKRSIINRNYEKSRINCTFSMDVTLFFEIAFVDGSFSVSDADCNIVTSRNINCIDRSVKRAASERLRQGANKYADKINRRSAEPRLLSSTWESIKEGRRFFFLSSHAKTQPSKIVGIGFE